MTDGHTYQVYYRVASLLSNKIINLNFLKQNSDFYFSGTWRLQNSVSLSLTLTWTLLSYTWHLLIIAILASLFSRTINSTKPTKSTSQKHDKDDKKSSKLSDKKSAGLEKISAIRKSTKSKCMPSEKPSYHIRYFLLFSRVTFRENVHKNMSITSKD